MTGVDTGRKFRPAVHAKGLSPDQIKQLSCCLLRLAVGFTFASDMRPCLSIPQCIAQAYEVVPAMLGGSLLH